MQASVASMGRSVIVVMNNEENLASGNADTLFLGLLTMTHLLRQALLTTLLASGLSAIALAPAYADGIKKVSIGGSAPSDYLLYDSNATETFLNPNASLQSILSGNKNSPTGNVELAASSEKAGFDFSKSTTLNGTIGGRAIAISSLTQSDWDTAAYKGSTKTFGKYWFDQALTSNGFDSSSSMSTSLFNIFKTNGGFQRFSDPNLSYVNQSVAGDISIGLAGHFNATPLFTKSIDQYLSSNSKLKTSEKNMLSAMKNQLSAKTIQASEVFKYSYNGLSDYGYSFQATASGLTERGDKISHTGNYEVVLAGPPAIKHVPEPGVLLSLAGVAAAGWKRRKSKSV